MKVKVRVAVVVGSDGVYNAVGYSLRGGHPGDRELMDDALDSADAGIWGGEYRRVWINAEVDVDFTTPEFDGTVELLP